VLSENYGAGLRLLDFERAPEEARQAINEWVSEQTEERIENLIPEGAIDPSTRLVLTNAIYFKAAWRHQLEEDQTRDGPFYPLGGGEVKVPMMGQSRRFGYAEGDGYQAVELPYVGNGVSMVILLPRAGAFETFERSLDAERVDAIVGNLESRDARLTMPRFEFDSSFRLVAPLADLGMRTPFPLKRPISPAWTARAICTFRMSCTKRSSQWTRRVRRRPPSRSISRSIVHLSFSSGM
jgi:serpin B